MSKQKSQKKTKAVFAVVIITFVVIAVVSVLAIINKGEKEMIVGKEILSSDINEFFYTYSSSANPPEYLRYHFYKEDNSFFIYHEKRKADHWPLTENDITESDTVNLTIDEWNKLLSLLNGGKVEKRKQSTDSGSSGPWLYIYWKNDKGKYQEFSFIDYSKLTEFEKFCSSLYG